MRPNRPALAGALLLMLALAATASAQEGNPCQSDISVATRNPNQIAFYIQDIDKLGVTTVEFVTFLEGMSEPQERVKIPRNSLQQAAANNATFINCFVYDYTPSANLARDNTTRYIIQARTEDANQRVSAWSANSNPFLLGTAAPPPDPLPLPVPGVRVGSRTP